MVIPWLFDDEVSALSGSTYNETAEGGAVGGGEADVSVTYQLDEGCCSITYEETPSGGAVGGGEATITTNFETPSGGAVGGGSAEVEVPTQPYEDFIAVYHLLESGNGASDEYQDSTANEYHAQGGQGFADRTPTQAAGVFFRSNEFDGNDFIVTPEFVVDDTSAITITLWAKRQNQFLKRVFYSIGQTDGNTPEGWQLQIGHTFDNLLTAKVQVETADDWRRYTVEGVTELNDDCWYHCAVVWNPGVGLYLYLNGVLEDSVAITETSVCPSTSGSYIGRVDNDSYAQAKMQEVRIAALVREEAWLEADYESFCDADFYTLSDEETSVLG